MNSPKLIQAHVLISGRVQGVGFRYNTRYKAQELRLTGWVRNLWDRRVEALFEGPEDAVREAVAWCHRGDPPARVENVEVSYRDSVSQFRDFRVKY